MQSPDDGSSPQKSSLLDPENAPPLPPGIWGRWATLTYVLPFVVYMFFTALVEPRLETKEQAYAPGGTMGPPMELDSKPLDKITHEQKKERDNEEEEVYQLLSDDYQDFLKIALNHPDLRLFRPEERPELSEEQRERMLIVFNMLISLFERAYLLMYEPKMNTRQQRRWLSWEDYMREWCRRGEFRALLPVLLEGEDAEFGAYIRALAAHESPTGSLLLSS